MATYSLSDRGGYSISFYVVLLFSFNFWTRVNSEKWDRQIRDTENLNLHNLGNKNEKLTRLFTKDGYFTDTRQDAVNPKVLGGIVIENEAYKLSQRLRWLRDEEMCVTNMQAIYDSLPYEDKATDVEKRLDRITKRLQKRFRNYLQVLRTNKITVQNLYKFHVKHPITKQLSCCDLPNTELRESSQYGCKVSMQTSCDLYPHTPQIGAFNPGRNLTEVWRSNVQYFPNLKWQYFISSNAVHSEYPANKFHWSRDCSSVQDIRHRDIFISTATPQPKHVVIVMDHGNSLSNNQLRTAKGIAKHLLRSLSEKDEVGIIGLASKPSFPRDPNSDYCLHNSLVPVTFETSLYFSKFIDNLEKENAATNHSLGFQTAFNMIENMIKNKRRTIDQALIIYISRGLLNSLTEAQDVMDTIAIHNGRLNHRVIINTYAVIDDGKPIMYEKSFLQAIADQNYAKYNVQNRSSVPIVPGMMMAVNTTKDLSISVGKFYEPLKKVTTDHPVFSLPYIDFADRGLTLSISQPCFNDNELIGVVGLDLNMEDIVQDVTYYDDHQGSYAFIIDKSGFTIMHPLFSRPIKTHLQPMHTDIWHFENKDGFARIRSDMLNHNEGERTLVIKKPVKSNLSDSTHPPSQAEFYAKYIWKRVENTPFIVVIKVLIEKDTTSELQNIHVSGTPQFVYHRLDLLPANKMCLHLKQLSTLELSTVYLSAKSFADPFEHLSNSETKKLIQAYTAYLKDDTRLITNPGFKEKVRNDVAATGRINTEWLRRFYASNLNDYIIRRYVATPSGVFRTYPGTLIDKMFDPTKRSWFMRASEFPGRVTLTAPYLDVGGAGYISTISHTIYEGKPAAFHGSSDKVVAVMGLDMTLGYFYKLLAENIPICEQKTVRCFIMDDKGYLVAHPALIEPSGKGPVEQQHITHKEPLVANDILNHRHFVKKTLCNRYNDRTVQRYYHFNTSLDGVLTNLVHGEHCARYQITAIPHTNAFLGIVNHTCETATAFCPCSMVDRLCLNCNRMEQSECECPCECPLEMNFCTGGLLDVENVNPSCTQVAEGEHLVQIDDKITDDLHQCFKHHCEDRTEKMSCLGVLDCEWCQLQSDGLSPLKTSYCASQRVCFGGVEGARTPYGDEVIKAMAHNAEPSSAKATPVGPVAGGIMGCFLVLALGVYCYRHHIHRNSHQYITSLPDQTNRMSHYYEPDEPEPADDLGTGHTNFVLATFDNPASVSPYRVNTSYRRPAGGDSDHGYSTMTPHEDSEHASLPCLEPLIVGKDRYRPGPHSVVVKTPILPPPPSNYRRSRSPTPPQTRLSGYQPIPEQTCLPSQTILHSTIPEVSSPNVLANVQVHMVDTH